MTRKNHWILSRFLPPEPWHCSNKFEYQRFGRREIIVCSFYVFPQIQNTTSKKPEWELIWCWLQLHIRMWNKKQQTKQHCDEWTTNTTKTSWKFLKVQRKGNEESMLEHRALQKIVKRQKLSKIDSIWGLWHCKARRDAWKGSPPGGKKEKQSKEATCPLLATTYKYNKAESV